MKNEAKRVSTISIIVNLLLAALKLLAGILAASGAMVSDAIHSASDVFSTIIVIIGIHISEKEEDADHPYGHERLECVAAFILATILAITGGVIGYNGLLTIGHKDYGSLAIPGTLALVAAIISIAVKEWMYHYTVRVAKRINSPALKADAWHHRSDALSSVGAFVGILFARAGVPIMDPIASVVICIFIIKAALEIFLDAVNKMVDHACPEPMVSDMKNMILNTDDVEGISWMKTRQFGAKAYLDVAIKVDGGKPLQAAHAIAENVHDMIEKNFPDVKHCMVHVDPNE